MSPDKLHKHTVSHRSHLLDGCIDGGGWVEMRICTSTATDFPIF